MNDQIWIEPLRPSIERLLHDSHQLSSDRVEKLLGAASLIRGELETPGSLGLNFICTHNSRRSHLAQIWAAVGTIAYSLDRVNCYSGGTEATACNPRVVNSLRRCGFSVTSADPQTANPRYQLQSAVDVGSMELFSKTYDDPANGTQRFVAMMCCDHADHNCPIIHGSVGRVALHYRDPKESDGSPDESSTYDARRDEIGAEMLFLMRSVAQSSDR